MSNMVGMTSIVGMLSGAIMQVPEGVPTRRVQSQLLGNYTRALPVPSS